MVWRLVYLNPNKPTSKHTRTMPAVAAYNQATGNAIGISLVGPSKYSTVGWLGSSSIPQWSRDAFAIALFISDSLCMDSINLPSRRMTGVQIDVPAGVIASTIVTVFFMVFFRKGEGGCPPRGCYFFNASPTKRA